MKPSPFVARTILAAASLLPGCGGGTPLAPTPAGPQTTTFSGMASTNAAGTCSGNSTSHYFTAGEGMVTVVVTQATASPVKIQICHPTAVNHATECTVPPFAAVAVGASVSATLRGGRNQAVTVYPEACNGPANLSPSVVSYTIAVTHPG